MTASPLAADKLFEFRGGIYAFLGIRLSDYARWARPISPRWDTLAMPTAQFREMAAPLDWFVTVPADKTLPAGKTMPAERTAAGQSEVTR